MGFSVLVFSDIHASLPTTAGGWVALATGIGVILGGTLGLVIRMGRAHIDRAIDIRLEAAVQKAVTNSLNNGINDRLKRTESKVDQLITALITKKVDPDADS
jgi:hypothetical protein